MLSPLSDFVLLEKIPDADVSEGGIVLPSQRRTDSLLQRGLVKAVGPGRLLDNGQKLESRLTPGDRVLFLAGHGQSVQESDCELIVIREEAILAKLECA